MALVDNGVIVDYADNNAIISSKFKEKITVLIGSSGTKKVEITVPFKYLSKFWKTLKMSLINCEIDLMHPWPANWVMSSNATADQIRTFAITDTKLHIPVATVSTKDKEKLFQLLKSGFKHTIIWNKYHSKV